MTPKSLLRLEQAASTLEEFTSGGFSEILPGPLPGDPDKVERIIFCSGKVYYDLLAYHDEQKIESAAIIRVEQLYPLHEERLVAEAGRFPNAKKIRLVPGRIPEHGRVDPHRPRPESPFFADHPVRGQERQLQPRRRFPRRS